MEARPWASPRAATTIFVNPFYEVAEVPRSEFGTRVTRGERSGRGNEFSPDDFTISSRWVERG